MVTNTNWFGGNGMTWEIITKEVPKGCILLGYPSYYDGGLFWYDPKTGECIKRWNDEFYEDRCPEINEVMQSYAKAQESE